MSINRLLALAGLLAIGACANPGPTAICVTDPNLDQEEQLCTPDRETPAVGVFQSSDNLPTESVQR